MTQLTPPPSIPMPEHICDIAEDITLADLLNSPSMACDAISLIANIINNAWFYSDIKTTEDLTIELDLFAISQAYGVQARQLAFSHLRDRRQYSKENR
jgi:hypothetical protein